MQYIIYIYFDFNLIDMYIFTYYEIRDTWQI